LQEVEDVPWKEENRKAEATKSERFQNDQSNNRTYYSPESPFVDDTVIVGAEEEKGGG